MTFRYYGDDRVSTCSEKRYLGRVDNITKKFEEKYGKNAAQRFYTEEISGLKLFKNKTEIDIGALTAAREQSRRKLLTLRACILETLLDSELKQSLDSSCL